MQISKTKLNPTLKKQVYAVLHQLLSDTKSPQEVEALLEDLLSKTEHEVLAKRLAIVLFLDKGRSYAQIKQSLKVSSATIATMHERMGNLGTHLAITKVKAEAWADEWAVKISSLVGKIIPNK